MQLRIFYLALILVVSMVSCGDDLNVNSPAEPSTPNINPPTSIPDINFPEPGPDIVTSISGAVTDISGDPLVAALVTCQSCEDNLTTTTDEWGSFIFTNVNNKGDQAYLSVIAPNKFDGYRRFSVLADKHNYTSIILRDKQKLESLDAQTGGTATLSSGAQLTLPSNGIVDSDGQNYSGEYDVYFSWIDPSSPQLAETMMGDLSGISIEGELTGLSTFGMLQVELQAPDGSSLNLGNGAEAELVFPVPQELMDIAPAEIPLWSFDETNGYWVEEGAAQLVDGFYIGNVKHFSTWNVDAKTDPINLSGEVRLNARDTDVGLSYFELRLSGESFNSVGGWLCNDGSYTFNNVPKSEILTIEIIDFCGMVIQTFEAGPFTESIILDPIFVSDSTDLTEVLIRGNAVDCSGNPLTNGIVRALNGVNSFSFPVDELGNFLFALTLCDDLDASLQILNLDDFSTSVDIQVTNLNENFILTDISLCEENEEYFFFEVLNPSVGSWVPFLILDPDRLWYTIADDTHLFQIQYLNGQGVSTFGFSQTIILDQIIQGTDEDGVYNSDGNGGYEIAPVNPQFQFYFSELGPLNAEGKPSYIEGSFSSESVGTSLINNYKGSFRLKYQ